MTIIKYPVSATYKAVAAVTAHNASFTNFDIGLPPRALADMQSLIVGHQACYDNFGEPDSLRGDLVRFLESLGNPARISGSVSDTVDQVVKDSLSAMGAEAAFFTLRAFTPTDKFKIPRWHTDGWFHEPLETKIQKKIALTLKGPRTLLNNLEDGLREEFYKALRSFEEDTAENRVTIAKLIDPARTQTPLPGQATILIVGDEKNATVHSEPDINMERLFMSIVPGTCEQIKKLRRRLNVPARSPVTPPAP